MITASPSIKNQNKEEIEAALDEILLIRDSLTEDARKSMDWLYSIDPAHRDSACNLLHYLSLRRRDLRKLQARLATLGLSSLGRAESHVLATVDAVIDILSRLNGKSFEPTDTADNVSSINFARGQELLSEHAEALLGPAPAGRDVRIMVTMPSDAAHRPEFIHDLLDQGMNCMRINCAHDDAATWGLIIDHLRMAEKKLGKSCRVFMDLSGPKLRTASITPGPAVIRIRPKRNRFGQVIKSARVRLTSENVSESENSISVESQWLKQLDVGDKICFVDARGSKRKMTVVEASPRGYWVEIYKTAYIVPGTSLSLIKQQNSEKECSNEVHRISRVIAVPAVKNPPIVLKVGDYLHLTRNGEPGSGARIASNGTVEIPARIGCTLPEALSKAEPGQTIWFDDGKIGGRIERVEADKIVVRIFQAGGGTAKLRSDKGINLPDTEIPLQALTEKDISDLKFVVHHADVVALSFASSAQDIRILDQHVDELKDKRPGIVLKIETKKGLENLPEMLLTAMGWPICGLMIARGDLAIECGFERLAEVQEEILWICEAGHVPVIWATQVLENLAKTGMPSRAEISDVVMGHRAECVMLNKGPFVTKAVMVLDDILKRMQSHQEKKSAKLRGLHLARL